MKNGNGRSAAASESRRAISLTMSERRAFGTWSSTYQPQTAAERNVRDGLALKIALAGSAQIERKQFAEPLDVFVGDDELALLTEAIGSLIVERLVEELS